MRSAPNKIIQNRVFLILLSFLLPSLLFGFILAQFGIYPFGDKSLLISDAFNQYIQFFNHLYDVFYNGKSLLYSWETGLGQNFLGITAYYVASPVSLLILFFGRNHLPEAFVFVTLVKIGLSGLTMYLFLSYFNTKNQILQLIFSVFYALMGFSIVYSFDIMWLDGIYMLPLILLGTELLLDKGKFTLFTLCLAYSFVSNFYISYMVGIFTFLYFLVRFFSKYHGLPVFLFVKKFFLFCISSVIAAGVSAFLILPTYKVIKMLTGNEVKQIPTPVSDFHLFDLYLKFFNGSIDSLINGLPTIYSGLLVLLLFPIFFISKKVLLKEKLLFLALFSFMIFSFQNTELNFIWHAMDNPNWFPYRYAFLVSFLVLYLAFRGYLVIDKTDWPYVKGLYIFNVLFLLFITKINLHAMTNHRVILNIAILTFYLILLYGRLFVENKKIMINVLIILVSLLDVSFNSAKAVRSLDIQFKYKTRNDYNISQNFDKTISMMKEKDQSFYRVNNLLSKVWNDSMQYDYKKVDNFNSLTNNDLNRFLSELGYTYMEGMLVAMNNGIVSSDSLLGFKYLIADRPVNKLGYQLIHKEDSVLLYENENVLPIGFVLNNQSKVGFPAIFGDNPFEKQNYLFGEDGNSIKLYNPINPSSVQYDNLSLITGTDGNQVFRKIDKIKSAFIIYKIPVRGLQQLNALLRIGENTGANIYVNNRIVSTGYPNVHNNRVLDLGGYDNETVTVKIEVLSKQITLNESLFYGLDMNLFENRIKQIRNQSLNVKNFSNTSISGNIYTNKKSVIFLSIPYDIGWSAKVDGKKAEIEKLGGFIGVNISKGKHEIQLNYVPPGFRLGLIISACSVLLLVVLNIINLFWRKRKPKELRNTQSDCL